MQQPALRLALLTFATILVSGCAEQFATHLVQTNWGTPVQMPHRRPSSHQAGTESSGEQVAGSYWSEKQKRKQTGAAWHFAKVKPFCLASAPAVTPERDEALAPACVYELLRNRIDDRRVVRTSDYCRERVG
ncbi:hypothetical protein DES53_102830 [Roseimicrobium gellanilyticum]|uniref:Lipoprotein n=1 Tax=Roseimicrobium gellanilyticum TaxID=748857 RepID=A0A366HT58_9BACT|nr:hypothetical protein [Roseimicrobium gellanilyticum]RBP46439.1 hypothetical protein DES53_102830 [Roseimicrobium gellanilyticum]